MRKVNKGTFLLFLQVNGLARKGMAVTIADPPLIVYELNEVIVAKEVLNRDGRRTFYIVRTERFDWLDNYALEAPNL